MPWNGCDRNVAGEPVGPAQGQDGVQLTGTCRPPESVRCRPCARGRDVSILLLDVDGVLDAARLDLPEGWRRARSTPGGDSMAHHLDDKRRPAAGGADGAAARAEDPRLRRRRAGRLPGTAARCLGLVEAGGCP